MCPACRKDAPIVYRGVMGYCTACGAVRGPLVAPSVNLAGQPSKVGGSVARVFGWIVLLGGLAASGLLGAGCQAVIGGYTGLLVGVPLAVLSAILGVSLLFGGKKLTKAGTDKQRETREKAIWALAENQQGVVSAMDVSRALDIPLQEADAVLTDMAKTSPDALAVDLDEHGMVYYRFTKFAPLPRVRIDGTPNVRVGAPQAAPQATPDAFDAEFQEEEPQRVQKAR
jgi:hypothetical protein